MPSGGPRPKIRADDQRNGRQPGARNVTRRRLALSDDAKQELRIITLHRRGITDNRELTPDEVVEELIHAAWLEYDAAISAVDAEEWNGEIL